MAEALSVLWKKAVLDAWFSGKTSAIKIVLLKSTYTFSQTHEYLSDVLLTHRSSIATLSGIGTSVVNTDDVRITATEPGGTPQFAADVGVSVTQAWAFHDTGVEATSRLIRFFDFAARSMDGGANITLPTSDLGEWREP